ncbi:MAG: hypothetical protein Kow00127_22970 [Bacteroidales bacterium]
MKRFLIFACLLMLLFGISKAQPPGYYDSAIGLTGDDLKAALHEIINDHIEYSYNDLRDFILKDTDEDPDNPNNIILLYTGRSQNKNTFGGGPDDWNREHVWAKSHGDFGNSPPCGTDAHHIRPTDASVNSSRGNKDFDNGGQPHPEATGCKFDDDSWEPRDEVKGDVARMIFYMAVRYEGDNGEPDLEVVDAVNTAPAPEHGKFSTLYQWHLQDPPDDFEMNRNEVVYSYQQNRNPFIDHPEFLVQIYDPLNKVAEKILPEQLIIAPNPASTHTVISRVHTSGRGKLVIYDLSGAEIFSGIFPQTELQLKIDTREFKPGIYLVKYCNDSETITSKLSVVR